MQAEMKEQNAVSTNKELEEQAALFEAAITTLNNNSVQSQNTSEAAITTLQAQLETTMAMGVELQKAKDQHTLALNETQAAARLHIAEQSRMLEEKMAAHEREQQRKTAEQKQALEESAKAWKIQLQNEMATQRQPLTKSKSALQTKEPKKPNSACKQSKRLPRRLQRMPGP